MKVICLLALFASVAEALGADKATCLQQCKDEFKQKSASVEGICGNKDCKGCGFCQSDFSVIGSNCCAKKGKESDTLEHFTRYFGGKDLEVCKTTCKNDAECVAMDFGSTGCNVYTMSNDRTGLSGYVSTNSQTNSLTGHLATDTMMSISDVSLSTSAWCEKRDFTCYKKQADTAATASAADTEADPTTATFEGACDEQGRFDVQMCKSHMCTDCTLAWCTEACQEVQLRFPACHCEEWPAARKTYSSGEFNGKGKFGDAGDYASAPTAFLNLKTKSAHDRSHEFLRK